jgi:hypothetical protein
MTLVLFYIAHVLTTAILLPGLFIVGKQKEWYWCGGIQWHNVHAKFREDLSTGPKAEINGHRYTESMLISRSFLKEGKQAKNRSWRKNLCFRIGSNSEVSECGNEPSGYRYYQKLSPKTCANIMRRHFLPEACWREECSLYSSKYCNTRGCTDAAKLRNTGNFSHTDPSAVLWNGLLRWSLMYRMCIIYGWHYKEFSYSALIVCFIRFRLCSM